MPPPVYSGWSPKRDVPKLPGHCLDGWSPNNPITVHALGMAACLCVCGYSANPKFPEAARAWQCLGFTKPEIRRNLKPGNILSTV
eukprot:7413262-Pyramimonas_sp.AAC.1